MSRDDVHLIAACSHGSFEGKPTRGGVVFHGIPYAAPALGALRFKATRAIEPRSERASALQRGPIAPQRPSRLDAIMGEITAPQAENCLTLSVWTPGLEGAARPVLVWLHGGAYISGAGSLDWYDGETLSSRGDIVVVNINYRLGALGYLALEDSNLIPALEDQRAALQWVHAHIREFGGDPDCVTLMGQSAGASSIAHLIEDPATARLGKRVILQSGGFGRAPLSPARAHEIKDVFVRELEARQPAVDRADLMEAASVEAILAAQLATMARFNGDLVFRPWSDGKGKKVDFLHSVAAASKELDVMIGCTAEEGRAYLPVSPPTSEVVKAAMDRQGGPGTFDCYRSSFPELAPVLLQAKFTTDSIFCAGSFRLAQLIARQGGTCFAYLFDWAPAGSRYGACHCIDLPFVFGNPDAWHKAAMLAGAEREQVQALTAEIQDNWIAFARSGKPADPGWSPFDSERMNVRRFGAGSRKAERTIVSAWLPGEPGDPPAS
jgi:para-nitrobenzyl esterase